MIVFQDIAKAYGKTFVLKEVSASVPAGALVVLAGHNGCGKTTLLKCLLGLVRPDSGLIRLDGRSIGGSEYRRRIGYMPQSPRYPENVTPADWLMLLKGIRGPASRLPELLTRFGFRGELAKPFGTLSGGTIQKFSAIVALMHDPDVLVMDEPTAGLDPLHRVVLKRELRDRSARGKTTLVTTHVLSELDDLADRLIWMDDGQIRYDGPTTEIRERTGESTLERALAQLMNGGTLTCPA